MRISQRADYGLTAILYLSQEDANLRHSLNEISQATKIPEEFLRKIFQTLAKSGIIDSFKGRGGGISLSSSPEEITILQLIELLEEKKGLVRCLREEDCPHSGECLASGFWQKIQEQLFENLDKTTVKDLMEKKYL